MSKIRLIDPDLLLANLAMIPDVDTISNLKPVYGRPGIYRDESYVRPAYNRPISKRDLMQIISKSIKEIDIPDKTNTVNESSTTSKKKISCVTIDEE
jgi:hypothetical protein